MSPHKIWKCMPGVVFSLKNVSFFKIFNSYETMV